MGKSVGKSASKEAFSVGRGPKFIVAFSGGLDSTVLLFLCALFFGPEAVLAVHVNHGLQNAAKSFENRARRTCREWGIRLILKRLKASPPKGESIEAWARNARYQALAEVAKEHAIEHVFSAHHQDDQLETLLIALSRGAGLEGLRGIAPNRPLGQAMLHRPLLDCSRSSLQAYASEHGLAWVEDPSNQDPRFLRNRIRMELIPALRSTLPGFARQASRSMAHLRQAASRLEEANLRHGQQSEPQNQPQEAKPLAVLIPAAEAASISRKALQALGEAEQAAVLRAWLRERGVKVPSQAKLAEIRKQLLESKVGPVSLPHEGKNLRRVRDRLWIEEESAARVGAGPRAGDREGSSVGSGVDPKAGKHGSDVRASMTPISAYRTNSANSSISAISAISAINPERTARGWICPLPGFRGMLLVKARVKRGSAPPNERQLAALRVSAPRSAQKMRLEPYSPRKTLKNLFQAAGIPAELRKRLPCISMGEEILFVAGLGTAPDSPWKFEFLPDL